MSFWNLSGGESAKDTGAEYEIPGGNMEPIPAGSSVLAMVDEAKWDLTQTNEEFVSLRWSVLAPEAYKNRKVFHKLWVTDHDPNVKDAAKAVSKTDKARKMLAAIDANAGGKLTAKDARPTSDDLMLALGSKPMVITLMIWEDRDGNPAGNWVSAVAPKTKEIKIGEAKAGKSRASRPRDDFTPGSAAGGGTSRSSTDDDEIPF